MPTFSKFAIMVLAPLKHQIRDAFIHLKVRNAHTEAFALIP